MKQAANLEGVAGGRRGLWGCRGAPPVPEGRSDLGWRGGHWRRAGLLQGTASVSRDLGTRVSRTLSGLSPESWGKAGTALRAAAAE